MAETNNRREQCARQFTRTCSRKRTIACVGLGLAALVSHNRPCSSCGSLIHVEASPLHQHRVGKPHRHVTYPHVIEKRKRGNVPSFWFPPEQPLDPFGEEETTEVAAKALPLDSWEEESGHIIWSLSADASEEHPHSMRTSIKHEDSDRQEEQGRADNKNIRQRRQQVTDKFVEDSSSAVIADEGSDLDSDNTHETLDAEDEDPEDNNYPGFNVTAEVLYNLSATGNGTDGGTSSSVLTSSSKLTDNSTTSSSSAYQPLRIRAILSEQQDGGELLTTKGREILLMSMLRPALLTWSAALRVEPVMGNLTVDKHQLFDNQTCGPGFDSGLPSPRVPSSHLTEGIPETDMVFYLSIGYTAGAFNMSKFVKNTSEPVSSNSSESWHNFTDSEEAPSPPQDGNQRMLEWSSLTSQSPMKSSTVEFREEWLLNSTNRIRPESSIPQAVLCSGDYVAAASYCSSDQYDRPTAGMLHICIDEFFFDATTRNKRIVTILHEVGHSLGFNSRSMAHFRRPDGTPITPRVDGEIVETSVECSGPRSGRRNATVALPSEEILQFRTVRGGVRVAEVVTPSVLQVVRNHFDCQNLSGAELESGEFSTLDGDPGEQACIGDHWERRLFQNDLMNPLVDSVEFSPYISTITLAYFADSGWYQVDLSMAELAASWGRGAGCGFVEETCIGENGQVPPSNKPFFCNAAPQKSEKGLVEEASGCTADLSRKAACSLGQYDTELPQEYQYFGLTYGGTVGGSDPYIDYCPTYSGFANGLCSNQENAALLQVDRIERFGTKNSRCLSGMVKDRQAALCLPIACVVEDQSLHVKIDGAWQKCDSKDTKLKVMEGEYVVCPDPRRVCPTFYCHHDCLGTAGWCNYDTGACECHKSGNYSLSDVSEGCQPEVPVITHEVVINRSLSAMPRANSPLSDYYVPFKDSLQDDYIPLRRLRKMIIFPIVAIIVAAILFWYFRMRDLKNEVVGSDDRDSPGNSPSHNPNKDKMIASVLVNMRMNNGEIASVAPTADTGCSLCELESSASAACSLCPSILENDDRCSLASESLASEALMEDDVLDAKPKSQSFIRKRRLKNISDRE